MILFKTDSVQILAHTQMKTRVIHMMSAEINACLMFYVNITTSKKQMVSATQALNIVSQQVRHLSNTIKLINGQRSYGTQSFKSLDSPLIKILI